MAERVLYFGGNHRILVDDSANVLKVQFYNSGTGVWKDLLGFDSATQKIHTVMNIKDGVQLQFGTDRDVALEYLGATDEIRLRDLINVLDLLKVKRNVPVQYESLISAINETARTGLAAGSTGIKWESIDVLIPPAEMLRYATVSIEATWVASHTDSVTTIELYDVTGAVVKASVSGNVGANVKSAYVALTAGNIHRVRVKVTTASATATATTGCTKAVLYVKFAPT
jgi:hypothetical protein